MYRYPRTQTRDATASEELWLPCSNCSTPTNHAVLASVDVDTDYGEFNHYERHQLVQCRGCNTVSFRRVWGSTDDTGYDPVTSQEVLLEHEELFPPRVAGRPPLPDLHYLPVPIQAIYVETHRALCAQQPILTGVGVRALVEVVATDQGASGTDLGKKIDSLVANKVLTPPDAAILHSLRIMGNKAAHEVKPHKDHELAIAFDVVEHLLQRVYILPIKAKNIGQ